MAFRVGLSVRGARSRRREAESACYQRRADAVVLVTARSVGAELATFDRKLRRIARSEGLVVAELQDDGESWPFPI